MKRIAEKLKGFVYEKELKEVSACNPKKQAVKKYLNPSDPKKLSNSLWVLLAIFVILILNIISFNTHYSLKSAYWFSNINKQYFNTKYLNSDTQTTVQYINITTVEDIEDYFLYFFNINFIPETSSSTSITYLNDKKILYGPYRIHTMNVETSS